MLKVAIIKKKELVKKFFPFYKKLKVGSSVLGLSDIFLQTFLKKQLKYFIVENQKDIWIY